MRSLLLATLVLVTSACGVVTVRGSEPTPDTVAPAARSTDGGVETWDLRGEPSAAAFGREPGDSAAVYQTDEPRRVRLLLPEGRTLVVDDAQSVDFRSFGQDRPDNWAFGVTSAGADLGATVARLSSILDQLGLPATSVAGFRAEAAAATGPEDVASTAEETDLGALAVNARAQWDPSARRGTTDVIGDWFADR